MTRAAALTVSLLLAASAADLPGQRIPLEGQALELDRICAVGADDGPAETVFGRITDVAVDATENMYVVDGLEQVVRAYDTSCHFRANFGRRGPGPGEFQSAISAQVGDSLLFVLDMPGPRQHVFNIDGRYVAERRGATIWQGICCGYQVGSLTYHRDASPPQSYLRLLRRDHEDTLAVVHYGRTYAYPPGRPREGHMVGPSYGLSASLTPLTDSLLVVVDGYAAQVTFWELSNDRPPKMARSIPIPGGAPLLSDSDHRVNLTEARHAFGARARLQEPDRWSLGQRALFDGVGRIWINTGDAAVWILLEMDWGDMRVYRLPASVRVYHISPNTIVGVTETDGGSPVLARYAYRLPGKQ